MNKMNILTRSTTRHTLHLYNVQIVPVCIDWMHPTATSSADVNRTVRVLLYENKILKVFFSGVPHQPTKSGAASTAESGVVAREAFENSY